MQSQLIYDNLGLVEKVFSEVTQYCTQRARQHYRDDLIQEGMIGLAKAVQTFDESRGVAFSTYAFKVIANKMREFLRKELHLKSKTQFEFVSLYAPVDETEEITIGDTLIAEEEKPGLESIEWLLTHPKLKPKHKQVLYYLALGYTRVEIGEMLGMTKQAVRSIIETIRHRLEKCGDKNKFNQNY